MNPGIVSACIVTRGGVDLAPILKSVDKFGEVVIWDNSKVPDHKVYGRYLAATFARNPFVFVVDDDSVIDAEKLCSEYRPGELLCNVTAEKQKFYPAKEGIQLVGWGAIFPVTMIDFGPYLQRYQPDELFERECDRIFTWLNHAKTRVVDIGVTELAHAHDANSMTADGRHWQDLKEIQRRLATLWG